MSSDDRRESVSSLSIDIRRLGGGLGAGAVACALAERAAEDLHALLDVEGRAQAGEGQAELYQRDGDRWSHTHDDRLRVEHARDRRDAPEHAADERIDHLEGGDVDEDGTGPCLDD